MKESQRKNVSSLLPNAAEFERPFWDGLQRETLLIQICSECGHTQFPPSTVCTNCLSSNISWTQCSGNGSLWSKVRFHKNYLEPYSDVPYSVAIAKLEEGHLLTVRLPEEYRDTALDAPIHLNFEKTADGTVVIICEPA